MKFSSICIPSIQFVFSKCVGPIALTMVSPASICLLYGGYKEDDNDNNDNVDNNGDKGSYLRMFVQRILNFHLFASKQ